MAIGLAKVGDVWYMRTLEETKKIVCDIVKFKMNKQPLDEDTMVISISVVEGYEAEAQRILRSLKEHRENIPKIITGNFPLSEITGKVLAERRRIDADIKKLISAFISKEC